MKKRATNPSSANQMQVMDFQEGERMFHCEAATSPATPETLWWWMSVTGESQRYAAFRTEASDTQTNLRPRIVAYYEQLLVDRARPREIRSHWAQRRPATPAVVVPLVAAAVSPAEA